MWKLIVALGALFVGGCVPRGIPRSAKDSLASAYVAVPLLHLETNEADFVTSAIRTGHVVFFHREGDQLKPVQGCSLRANYTYGFSNVIDDDPVGDLLARASVNDLLGEKTAFVRGAVVPRPNLPLYVERLQPTVTRSHEKPIQSVSATLANTLEHSEACDTAEFVAAEFEFGKIVATAREEAPPRYEGYSGTRIRRDPDLIYQLGGAIGCKDIGSACEVPLAATLIPLRGETRITDATQESRERTVFPSAQLVAYEGPSDAAWSVGIEPTPLCLLPCSVYVPAGAAISLRLRSPAPLSSAASVIVSIPKMGESRIGLCSREGPKTSRAGSGALIALGTGIAIASAFIVADARSEGPIGLGKGSTTQITGNVGDKLATRIFIPILGIGGLAVAGAGLYSFFKTEKKTTASARCTSF